MGTESAEHDPLSKEHGQVDTGLHKYVFAFARCSARNRLTPCRVTIRASSIADKLAVDFFGSLPSSSVEMDKRLAEDDENQKEFAKRRKVIWVSGRSSPG
jgi:hypothetical protein